MNNNSNVYFKVINAGILCTFQDLGRFQQGSLGLTTGGPADKAAYLWANRLLNNPANSPVLELSFGGLTLVANTFTTIAITGAKALLTINGQPKENWQSHHIKPDDEINIGFASQGCRIYLAVADGFLVKQQFGSASTVVREKVGGSNGLAISAGQLLAITKTEKKPLYRLAKKDVPDYNNSLTLKMITGYQHSLFDRYEIAKFFANEYQISSQCDRMGYRLTGTSIQSKISKMFSEGICQGAVQIPPDGQPIVLSNDRQTIGGYPKIGSVLSRDLDYLMQCSQGNKVNFEPISIHCAHNILHLAKAKYQRTQLLKVAM